MLRDGTVPEGGGILGLTKTGSKILTLTGANTYGGGTIVSGGKLLVNNTADSGTGTGSVTVNSGATLGGTGTIAGAVIVNIGGHLAPGTGPLLKLKVGTSVKMTADSIYDWEFDGTNASTVDIQGSLQLDSGWEVALAGSIAPGFGSKFDLFTYTPGSFTGSLTAVIDYSGVTDWPVSWIGQDDGAGKIYLAFGPKPGDANGDGIVDAADYIRLKQYFGQSTANGTNGDFNGDGMVNWTDRNTSPVCNIYAEKNVIIPRIPTCASPLRAVFAGHGHKNQHECTDRNAHNGGSRRHAHGTAGQAVGGR